MGQISARMLRGPLWLENQDFGVSVGAIGIIFRDTSFPISPRFQDRLFRKIVPGVQGRRNGCGKNCLHFLGQIATKATKHVAEPILAPESRFRGIRWGNLYHFSKSVRSESGGAAAAAGSFDTVMITGAKFDRIIFPLQYSLGQSRN